METSRTRWFFWVVLLLLFGIAATLRIRASLNELWLDEIWSLDIAFRSPTLFSLFQEKVDNNHLLNTMWLWWLGKGQPDWMYRSLAVFASCLAVGVAGWVGWGQSRLIKDDMSLRQAGCLFAMILVGFSYPLLLSGTEARGYSFLVFFSLLSWGAFLRGLSSRSLVWPLLYGMSGVFAIFSHLTSLFLFVGVGLWTLGYIRRNKLPRQAALRYLFQWHCLPAISTIVLIFSFLLFSKIGGGPHWTYRGVLGETAGLLLGIPESYGFSLAFPLFVLILIVSFRLLTNQNKRLSLLYLVVMFGLPSMLLLIRPVYLAPRYFLVTMALFMCLLSLSLSVAWMKSWKWKFAISVFVASSCIGNLHDMSELFQKGRGSCLPMMKQIAAQSDKPVMVVYDHKIRTKKVLDYYRKYNAFGARLSLFPHDSIQRLKAKWLFVHQVGRMPEPPDEFFRDYVRYRLVRRTSTARGSGLHWYLYKRIGYR